MRKTYRITICLANPNNIEEAFKRIFKYILKNKEFFDLSRTGINSVKEHLRYFDYFQRNCTSNLVTKKGVTLYEMHVGCYCNSFDRIFVKFYYGHTIYKDLEYIIVTNK